MAKDWLGRETRKGTKPHSRVVNTPIKKTTTKSRKPKSSTKK